MVICQIRTDRTDTDEAALRRACNGSYAKGQAWIISSSSILSYRREDAKEKKGTMDTYWIPGVNHLKSYGRWAFAEFTEVYQIEADFQTRVETEFNRLIERVVTEVTGKGSAS